MYIVSFCLTDYNMLIKTKQNIEPNNLNVFCKNEGVRDVKLQNKIAMVTGAAQGIGKGVALEYAKNGADLAVFDINGVKLADTVREIEALGRKCIYAVGDVSDSAAVQAFVQQTVENYGKIDILTHCAGILRSCAIIDQEEKDWDAVIAVNLRSSFLFSKYVGRQMKQQGNGAIVLVDSCASKTAEAFNAVYCASKAGVRLLAQSLALELAEFGVRVNSIAPGTINTDMIQRCLHDRAPLYGLTFEEYLHEFNEATPLKRMGEPEEIGKLCVFLVSDDSAFITGSSFNISGGRECH